MRQALTRHSAVVWLLASVVISPASQAGPPGESGPSHAPLPDERLGIRTAPLLLLSRPDVSADLGLSARQRDDAESAISDLYVRAAGLKGTTGPPAVAMRKAIDEAQRQWFETHLTAEQLNRLVQIDLQWEGPSSLVSRPQVADTLGLTPAQRTALKQAVASRDSARAGGGPNPNAEQALARQTLTVLSAEQKERWRAMLGNPFTPRLGSSRGEPRTAR